MVRVPRKRENTPKTKAARAAKMKVEKGLGLETAAHQMAAANGALERSVEHAQRTREVS